MKGKKNLENYSRNNLFQKYTCTAKFSGYIGQVIMMFWA